MEINYRCNRCKKIVRARVSIQVFKGKARKRNGRLTKEHCRVDCLECGRYIKFISEGELNGSYPNWRNEVNDKRTSIKKIKQKNITNPDFSEIIENQKEIKFKLDVIIDLLSIEDSFIEDYKLYEGGKK